MKRLALALCLCALALTSRANVACDRFAAPDAARLVVVADDMLVNGVPMRASELHSRLDPQTVAQFYRGTWEGKKQKVQETAQAGWTTLSTRDGDCFFTAQIRAADDHGTYALLGVTKLGVHPVRARGEGFPKMGGSVVYNDIISRDDGKTGRTLLMGNSYTPAANADFYRSSLGTSGWVVLSDRNARTAQGQQWVQIWRRGLEEANVVIASAQDGSQVVVNVVDRP